MKTRKIGVIASLLLLALALPALSIPKANAFGAINFVQVSGLVVASYRDPFYNVGNVAPAREGSTVNFNVQILTNGVPGQRNITVGVKLDWMSSFVNASNARPGNTLALNADQMAIVTVGVTMPAVSGSFSNINLVPHSWELRIWSGQVNASITPVLGLDCPVHRSLSGCDSTTNPLPFAVYSNAQADGVLATLQASAVIGQLTLTLSRLTELPPGAAKASSDMAQAKAEQSLGDTSYGQGDFAGAKTHYTNALNFANSAASDLAVQGGGVDSAAFWQLILSGTGALLVGVGVFVAAVAAWIYLHRRSRTLAKTA